MVWRGSSSRRLRMRERSTFSLTCESCNGAIELPDKSGTYPCPKCEKPVVVDWRVLTIPAKEKRA